MSFETELKKGNFTVAFCNKCKKTVWPPSEYCDKCFNETQLNNSNGLGKILEFSKQGKNKTAVYVGGYETAHFVREAVYRKQ